MNMKRMLVVAYAVAVAFGAWADTETVGGYTWTYRIKGDTAEIYNNGYKAISPEPTGTVTIPSTLGGKPVTSIGSSAFSGCGGMTSVTIPFGVTSIDSHAFYSCLGLTSVTIPASVTSIGYEAFYGCSGLTSVTIPDSVMYIGGYAFSDCSGLTSVTIPDGVTSIGMRAFRSCSGLTSVTIPDSVTSIGDSAFSGCGGLTSVTIPQCVCSKRLSSVFSSAYQSLTNVVISGSVTSIGSSAFSGCSGLTSVTIPNSVTSIGDWAFNNCSGLTSVTIPSSVTSIGSSAFYYCRGLTSVTIGNGVTSIGSSAFYHCSGLTSVTIPNSVTSIGSSAFSGCSGLTSVTIGNGVTSIGNYAFSGCSGLTDMTIPSSVTSMGEAAFSGCSGLTSVTIPGSVTYIKKDAFSGCSGLTSVTILSSVTSIGEAAFSGCSGLTSVTIPGSVTWIDYDAFSGCSGLTSVHITDLKAWCGISFRESSSNPLYYAHDLYLNGEKVTTLTIPDSVTSIRDYAFRHCSGLTNVTIPDSVTSIGAHAFDGCSCLTNVAVGSGIKEVGTAAFNECGRLKSVQISDLSAWASINFSTTYYPATTGWGASNPLFYAHYLYQNGILVTNLSMVVGIDEISDIAFCNCKGLQGTLIIPTGVTRIGDEAFAGSSVTNVIIPDSVNRIGYGAFGDINAGYQESVYDYDISEAVTLKKVDGWVVDRSKLTTNELVLAGIRGIARAAFSYSSITNVVIAEGVHGIGGFENCSRLEHVTIPNSATDIGDNAFYNCRKLTSVTIPDGVTSIGNCAFRDCSGLTDMTIPSSVTSIGDYAFDGCSGLTSVLLPKRFEGSLDKSVFAGCPASLKITYYDHYAIRFIRNDGAGTVEAREFYHGVNTPLPTVASLGFARRGMVFKGWATSSANAAAGKIWKTDGAIVATPTAVGTTMDAIAVWELADGYYGIKFNKNDGTGKWRGVACKYGEATALPSCGAGLGWTRAGYTFKGWATSAANAAAGKVWKGDRGTVQTAASAGTTLNVYAIWEKTLTYTIKYGKYDGTGETFSSNYVWGVESHVPTATKGPLFWQRAGFDWLGWSTSPANADAGKVWKAGWGSISKPVDADGTLSVYACWRLQSGYYAIKFFRNDGTAAWRSKAFQHGVATRLPSMANGLRWSRAGYAFKGWATSVAKAAAGTVYRADWGIVTSPVAEGQTLTLYAIWRPIASANQVQAARSASAGVSHAAASAAHADGAVQSAAIAVPQATIAPGYYVGRLADGSGAYELIVGDDQEAGIVRIDFDSGESFFAEVEVIMFTDAAIVIATEDGDTYWLLP